MSADREKLDFVLGKAPEESKRDAEAPLVELDQLNINDYNIENELEEQQDSLPEEELKKELLFCVQEVGAVKRVNDADVYVKGPDCEVALRDLHRYIRHDSSESSIVRLSLGQWCFIQKDLLPLLLSQTKDKKLSFCIIILLVDLTEMPELPSAETKESNRLYSQLIEQLQNYKLAFLAPNVIQTLLTHMADCLQKPAEQRNERHDQMIELIVVLFKHLLKIPDMLPTMSSANQLYRDLQKKLIMAYHDKNVLDSFIFLTQDIDSPLAKRLSLHFLEIFYFIFKHCSARGLVEDAKTDKEQLRALMDLEKRNLQRRMAERGTRPNNFGTAIKVPRGAAGDAARIVSNIFRKDELTLDGAANKGQHARPRVRKTAGKNVLEATQDRAHQVELYEGDPAMIAVLRTFAADFLENSFSPLMEWVCHELASGSSRVESSDKSYYMEIAAFMLEFWRMRLAKEQQKAKDDQRRANPGKPMRAPNVHFDIASVGAILQISTFEYVYSEMMKESKISKKRDLRTRDYRAGVRLLTQALYSPCNTRE